MTPMEAAKERCRKSIYGWKYDRRLKRADTPREVKEKAI